MEILLVEDSPEVSLITVEYLMELGHRVVAVTDAERAIAAVADKSFDLVITDVSLPGMSGIDLAKALAQRHPTLPLIISSGYGAPNIRGLLGSLTSRVRLLPKPYDLDMLERTLQEAAAMART